MSREMPTFFNTNSATIDQLFNYKITNNQFF